MSRDGDTRTAARDPAAALASGVLKSARVAAIFASEIAVFYYALGAWRSRPHAPEGTVPYSHHRRSGQGAIVFALLFLLLVEGIAVHFLLLLWHPLAAWIVTISTAYGALWLLADYRATVLRPILVDEESILIRGGLRFTSRMPLDRITSVGRERPDVGKEARSLPLLGMPSLWITLSEPTAAQGPYGLRFRVRAVGVTPDDPEGLVQHLASRSGRRR